jgi:hypothetical protein
MTTSAKVWIPFLVTTMLIRRWEELIVAEGTACNHFPPTLANILCNGNKGVANFIMGPHAFIAMGAM